MNSLEDFIKEFYDRHPGSPLKFPPLDQYPNWLRTTNMNWQFRVNICGGIFKQHYNLRNRGESPFVAAWPALSAMNEIRNWRT